MRIKEVTHYIISHKLDESFYFSQWHYDRRTICLVKVTTDEGLYGWGEGYGPAGIIKAGIDFFAPLLIGKDPLQQENIWRLMHLRSLDFARRGVMLSALSALDIALWDLKGKILKQPVSVLLGGRKREKVKAYATGLYFRESENLAQELAEEALFYKNAGFEAVKMKVGLNIRADIENVKAVREILGPDVELMVDANHAYSLREAIQLANAIEPYDISWFEEPISPEEYDNYRELRLRTKIPIAGGECEYLRFGFQNLFINRCVDIAQPDVCATGGITEFKKIMSSAQTFGVDVVPHSWGTGIALSAALHLISNWDTIPGRLYEPEPLIEFDRTENPLRDDLIKPRFSLENGRLDVPTTPGLGIDVDTNLLSKYESK